MTALIEMRDICKSYYLGDEELEVLHHIDFVVEEGEFVSILGPSGSGKSTMMNIIGCLDVPTSGTYRLAGVSVQDLSEAELARVRNTQIGFVFQSFQLLSRHNALENVELRPCWSGSGWVTRCATSLASSPVASSSWWRSRAP